MNKMFGKRMKNDKESLKSEKMMTIIITLVKDKNMKEILQQ